MEAKQITLEITKGESQKLAKNLQALLEINKVSIVQIAHELGIPVITVRRLTSGSTTDPRISTLQLFAERFQVTVDLLMKGTIEDSYSKNKAINSKGKHKPHFVPILDWETIAKITSIRDLNLDDWNEWQPVSLSQGVIGQNSFALKSRPSMYPRFSSGTIFIIDPDVESTDGDTVLIRIKSCSEITLRTLIIDPPDWELHSILSDANYFKYLSAEHEIVGVVMLTLLFNKKFVLK